MPILKTSNTLLFLRASDVSEILKCWKTFKVFFYNFAHNANVSVVGLKCNLQDYGLLLCTFDKASYLKVHK